MDIESDTPGKLDLALKIMKAHEKAQAAFGNTTTQLAGGLMQLRAHERGVEGHDDIVAQLKDELLDELKEVYARLSEVLVVPDARCAVSNDGCRSDALSNMLTKYKSSFTKSSLAPVIIDEITTSIDNCLTAAMMALGEMLNITCTAIDAKLVEAPVEELNANVRESLNEAWVITKDEVNSLFNSIDERFDAIAVEENKLYHYLMSEGYEASKAFDEVCKRFGDRVQQLIFEVDEQEDDDDEDDEQQAGKQDA